MTFLNPSGRIFGTLLLILTFVLITNELVIGCPSRRIKDVAYAPADPAAPKGHLLDVYAPKKRGTRPYPVVLFIHGGSWDSGSKNFYWFVGRRLAKQGVVAVVLNYRLAPAVEVPAMAADCAAAVRWTTEHIDEYGGDPARLYVMGHSAGGGLAALLATNDSLLMAAGLPVNPIRGAILDDPAGLNMYTYLRKMQYPGDEQYLVPFGKEPAQWKTVSPFYYLSAASPPFLIFMGGNTYPGIKESTREFRQKLTTLGHAPDYTLQEDKKHIPMVLQLFWKRNIIYQKLLPFVGAES